MPRFRFVLEPLLKVRRLEEDRCRRTLAHLERARLQIEDTLRRHQQNLSEGKSEMRRAVTGRVNLGAVRFQAAASMSVMRRAQQTVLQLAGLHKQIERARRELVERSRARRAIEILRERRYAEWQIEEARAETTAIDELALSSARFREVGA